MLISQRSEYGIRALADIVANGNEKPVNRSDIARRQQIPLPYLTQVLGKLVSGDLLTSTRGPSGGYRLKRQPDEISLLDVVTLLQGPVAPAHCSGTEDDSDCERIESCGLAGVWSELKTANEQVLGHTTLEAILADAGEGRAQASHAAAQAGDVAETQAATATVTRTGNDGLLEPDEKLDCLGVPCPMPIVKVAEAMMDLDPGQVLEVWADDEGAKADIPAWCTGTGNDFLGCEEFGNQMKFLVRKVT